MHEYRITVVGDDGHRFVWDRASEMKEARSLLAEATEKYQDGYSDVFIERRELNPWMRYEPPVPLNQPSLPL